ncbi:MAG: DUF4124 domain-containing protein [Gammaproteobacteria bacterium]|nr:DUF4124 domain-containing protein [Gammaproteobacteria bacterium]NIR84270.1 DUF4124 domain-containing protein [Gammaproteobacteria bacterium]NIR89740.1 DUF4124 domain-containing protein [Gammaproteobacteria bacterium]NIU05428.1 DUF4124 domain-containing protein [Gammaproteobacteria bacterium]NIV52374.1 DUF4124 domain-containing protein [Gammaproteobacteria bacterium]
MRSWIVVTLLAVALAAPSSALARVYKWVDDEGNVQYSQSPPSDRPAETIETRVPTRPSTDEGNEGKEPDAEAGDGAEQVAMDRQAQKQRNCEIARENAKLLEAGVRVQVRDGEGNPQMLDEEQMAQKLEESRRQIELFCND